MVSLMAPLNSSMVAVALPDIRHDLGVGVGALTWLISGYLIAVVATQPVAGRLGDAYGHSRIVLIGLAGLIVTSLVGALAWSFPVLVAARTLQGVAAGCAAPNAIAALRARIPADRLTAALGRNGAATNAGAALGPAVGGLLLVAGDWRWLFFANIPVAVVAALLVLQLPRVSIPRRAAAIDFFSVAAVTLFFTALTIIGVGVRIHNVPLVVASAVASLAILAAYGERYRRSRLGVVDLRLFSRRDYAAAAFSSALANMAFYTVFFSIPVYLADVRHRGDAVVAMTLLVTSLTSTCVSPFSGRIAARFGTLRPIITGAGLLLFAMALLAGMLDGPPIVLLLVPMALVGIALGLSGAPQQGLALRAWPATVAGSASGTYSMMRYVGSISGTAIAAGMLGAHPGEERFRALFAVLAVVALANLAVVIAGRSRTTSGSGEDAELSPLAVTPGPSPAVR
ncbi:hypothetical protein AYO38_00260 [bacterium SCGC AG-212-C10]|nr:hypothetical protein AYO38_00260 [bacterium SCGC AG-212-C10]